MASAGQAQAHSSQPMHFSRPSGCRFSWWRPWKRGWVGRLTSGYSSGSSVRNIVANVTPKPATGANSCERKLAFFFSSATGVLLIGQFRVAGGVGQGVSTLQARLVQALAWQRRNRVAPREGVDLLGSLDDHGGGFVPASQTQATARARAEITPSTMMVAVRVFSPKKASWAPWMKATETTHNRVTGMRNFQPKRMNWSCLLYTSDAADE